MKKTLLLCCLILETVLAQFSDDAGKTYFNFVRLNPVPQAAAMGKLAVADSDNAPMTALNPASLAFLENRIVFTGWQQITDGIHQGMVAGGMPWREVHHFWLGMQYLSYGEIDGRDEMGVSTGNLSAGDFALSCYYGRKIGAKWAWGLGAMFMYSSLDGLNASGLGLNGGLIFQSDANGAFGLSLLNMGLVLSKFHKDDAPRLPFLAAIGWSKPLAHLPVVPSITLSKGEGSPSTAHIGLNVKLVPAMNVRLGYYASLEDKIRFSNDETNRHGFTYGLDMRYRQYALSVAFLPFGKIGVMEQKQFAFSYNF